LPPAATQSATPASGCANTALLVSVVVTLCALLIFGAVKERFTGVNSVRSGLQTALIGGVAARAAFLMARFITR
jgi:vacuolar iron transporter family protein